MRRNRYRTYPKEKAKRPQKSIPLKRSVHIDGKRWGWEYSCNLNAPVQENEKIKIVSPDNCYFEISKNKMKELEKEHTWPCGQKRNWFLLNQEW